MSTNLIIAICYYVILLVQFMKMWSERKPRENTVFTVTIPESVMENDEIKKVQKSYGNQLIVCCLILAAAPAVVYFSDWVSIKLLLWMALILLAATVTYIPYILANKKVKTIKEQNRYMDLEPEVKEIDAVWKHGIFYNNPEDDRLTAEKRIGIGTCINHAKPMGKFLTVLGVVALIFVFGFGVYSLKLQSTPLSLKYEDGILKAGQVGTKYTVEADVIQTAMLLDEMPEATKVVGTGMDNIFRGVYNVSGWGNCNVNLNPQNHAFILIQAEDGRYIFSADTDEETEQIFEELKNDI